MAENVEVTRSRTTSPTGSSSAIQPSSNGHLLSSNESPTSPLSHHVHGHEATFVRPADLLRPRAISRPLTPAKPDRPIDRDERAGLKAIRDFLRVRTCYEVLPLSFRLIELDVGLTVKESLNILVQCGIVSAPLWDSATSTYAGLLTVTDYLNVVRYYNLHADKLKDIDKLVLSDLKGRFTPYLTCSTK